MSFAKTCERCLAPFMTPKRRQRFCSLRCAARRGGMTREQLRARKTELQRKYRRGK